MSDGIYDLIYNQEERELRLLYQGMKMLLCSDVIITGKEGEVGLLYVPGCTPAPVVMEMSVGGLKRIRDLVNAQGILVAEDQKLSKILWDKAEIGTYIPKEAYKLASDWLARALLAQGEYSLFD